MVGPLRRRLLPGRPPHRPIDEGWASGCDAVSLVGVVTTALLFDDLFLFHEHAPIAQPYVFAGYGLAVIALGVAYREFLRRTDFPLLAVALGLLAMSATMDRLVPGAHLLEDGSKFLGIATWATYWVGTGVIFLREAFAPGPEGSTGVRRRAAPAVELPVR